MALSSDDTLACTVSKSAIKVWNVESRRCIQTVVPALSSTSTSSCFGLCSQFLPGNDHVLIGTREGHLLVISTASGEIVFAEDKAHSGAIWALDVLAPKEMNLPLALLTGSADKSVKFWRIESNVSEDRQSGDIPVLVHTRTLQLSDDVVAARFSHSGDPAKLFVIVASLDSSIKVFFNDSLKLFLTLYGHKLPALAIDSSDDGLLLVSGGADKTVKIWGLDFGDTHKTLHGHEDSITDIRFVRRTHYFFTSSKDFTIRYWDADRFQQVLLLNGHFAEANCLAVARSGAFVLSGGMDRQVRVWERTKDIVFIEEERERELEQFFDRVGSRNEKDTAAVLEKRGRHDDDDDKNLDEVSQPQSESVVRSSILSVAAGDRLMEGLERADEELRNVAQLLRSQSQNQYKVGNPMLLGLEPAQYVLWILKSIRSSDLEQSLLVLSLRHVERLIYYCTVLLRERRGIEICSKVGVFIVKVHQNQLARSSLAAALREFRRAMRTRLAEAKDMIGYNVAAMKLIGRISSERKQIAVTALDESVTDVWTGLGLGSDVAAALQGRRTKKR